MELNNRRIVKNTVFIYIRLFSSIVIGLYTSRVVLQILGVSDYGLFNVVGGILAMFTFLCNSLSVATSRFFNTEMGKPGGDLNKSFCINLFLHVCLALLIFSLAETIGTWYIYNKLAVEPGKIGDAIFIYNVAIIVACIGIINNPYNSLFVAHEKFQFITILEICNLFIRLFCVVLLQNYEGQNVLRLYSMIVGITTANTFVVYHFVAARRWAHIIKFNFIKGWKNYKDVLTFSNWNLLGTISYMVQSSGCDLVLNSFFGTAVNGAYAISKSVSMYVTQFSNNFDAPAAPQIIKAYAAGDEDRYMYLAYKVGRFSLLCFELLFFPLFIELDFILQLWLGTVPDGALVFTKIQLLMAAVALTGGGFTQIITASGKIKWFKIELSILFISCVPMSYLLFSLGYPPYCMLLLLLIADIIQRIIQLFLANRMLNFNVLEYIKEAYLRPSAIAIIMTLYIYAYSQLAVCSNIFRVGAISCTLLLSVIMVFRIGLKKTERDKIVVLIQRRLQSIK